MTIVKLTDLLNGVKKKKGIELLRQTWNEKYETLENLTNMGFIRSRTAEINAVYKERLAEDRDYRKVTKELLSLLNGYKMVDDCFEFSAELSDRIEQLSMTYDDAVTLIRRSKRYNFYTEPQDNEVYGFTKKVLGTLTKKWISRNEYHARLDELEKSIGEFGLSADFSVNFNLKIDVEHTEVIVNFDAKERDTEFEDKYVSAIQSQFEKVDASLKFLQFYAAPKEYKALQKERDMTRQLTEEHINEVYQRS